MTPRSPVARLSRDELTPLVVELARRFGDGPVPTSISLRALTDRQRSALADLLGDARLPPPNTRIRLDRLQAALGLSEAAELRAIVEVLGGPIVDRRAARASEKASRDALWAWLGDEIATLTITPTVGALDPWIEGLRRAGIRGGVEGRRAQLEQAIAVMRALPADGVSLAAFANDVLSDSHALDFGRALPRSVVDGIAIALGRPIAGNAEDTRQLWEDVGVAPDLLSSNVLCLGLRAREGHPLGEFLTTSADASEPVVLTLAQLRRWPLDLPSTTTDVYVVENPSVIAEAAARDWRGPVLVCSSGRPTVAVVTLIRQLIALGASGHQHADFDPSGLAITAWLTERAGTSPWRMSAEDYAQALRTDRRRVPLLGTVPASTWDPALSRAMLKGGVAIFEEEVRSELLDSISGPSAPLHG